ncbi:MAG: VOC family protein [Pseudomonadota bacterium]
MPKIDTLEIRVTDPKKLVNFYRGVLGMTRMEDERMRYGAEEAAIRFFPAERLYKSSSNDVYWKIALSVPDIELACSQLSSKGVSVGHPEQFRDVGYLAHFNDPGGFTVELIEHYFKGDRPDTILDESLLGGGARLNLITLRTADMTSIKSHAADWGMTLICIQPLESIGFTLYFFAFTNESPPSNDLTAIENRTWVYQRPYTVLEIQHIHGADRVTQVDAQCAGYQGVRVSGVVAPIAKNELHVTTVG